MKQALVIYLLLLSTLSYSQSPVPGKYTMSADSFILVMDKKNSEFIGKPFPKFSALTSKRECSNQTLKDKVVFINFWFAACAPCMAEMGELNKLFENFKQNKNFEFVSFTFEDSREINVIKKKYNIQYDVFSISRDECYRLNNNSGFPTSVILDATGTVKYIHSGDQLNKIEIKKYFTAKVYPLLLKEINERAYDK